MNGAAPCDMVAYARSDDPDQPDAFEPSDQGLCCSVTES